VKARRAALALAISIAWTAVARGAAPPDSAAAPLWPDAASPADTLVVTPHARSVTGRAGLARRDDPAIAGVVEHANGVRARGLDDRLAPPIVRGLGTPRVVILASGAPLEDFAALGVDGPRLDARAADRIDVIRPPRAAGLDPAALGGAIRVEPRALEFGDDGAVTRAGAEGYAGTAGLGTGAAFTLAGARGPIAWRLGGGLRHAPDLSEPSRTIERTSFHSADGDLAIGARGEHGRTELRVALATGTFDLPLPPDVAPGTTRDLDDRRVQWLGAYTFAPWVLEARGQWQGRRLETTTDGDVRPPLDLDLDAYRLELLGRLDRARWGIGLGASGLASTIASRLPLAPIPDARVVSGALLVSGRLGGTQPEPLVLDAGAETVLESTPWSVRALARVDLRHLEVADDPDLAVATQTRIWSLGAGAIEAAYRFTPELTGTLGLGRAWRAPTLIERYARGAMLDRARYRIGRRDLDAERGLGIDGALAWRSRRVRAAASGFAQRIDDFVAFASTGEVRDGLPVERPAARPVVFSGGELSAEVEVLPALALIGRVDHARGQDRDIERAVDGVPPSRGDAGRRPPSSTVRRGAPRYGWSWKGRRA
jgi:outer membrane receptor protein involved in Fe transport